MTLVEFMVGVTLGLLATVVMLRLLVDSSTQGVNLQRVSAQVENARYAVELLSEDLQLAGYYAEASIQGAASTDPNPCAIAATDFTALPLAVPAALQGYASTDGLGCAATRQSGTDALAVRRLATTTTNVAALGTGNDQYYVQASFCVNDPAAQPLVFSKSAAAFVLQNRVCSAANTLHAYVPRLYFVAPCNDCSGSGDHVPTLKRLDLAGSGSSVTSLVEGIELMRFEYGFDTDGDGAADTYATTVSGSGAASLWSNVVAVKMHLVVRSVDKAVGPPTATAQNFTLGGLGSFTMAQDGYVRRAYSTVVRLNNVAGQRESS